jgi:hypothetical protein
MNQTLSDLLQQLRNTNHMTITIANLDNKKAKYQLKRSKLLNRVIELLSELILLDELQEKQ